MTPDCHHLSFETTEEATGLTIMQVHGVKVVSLYWFCVWGSHFPKLKER